MSPATLARVLVHVQASLDQDLSVQALASVAGISAFHFAREFHVAVGEPPKQYVNRLRVERAAIRLLLHAESILMVALDSGFSSHEVFTRAFRRRFGRSPREYRKSAAPAPRPQDAKARSIEPITKDHALSPTKLHEMEPLHVAFMRHTGPYENVDAGLWDRLLDWAARRHVKKPWTLLGIAHDAPGITPPDKLRFDAALHSPGPLPPDVRIGRQELAGGTFALTTSVGPFSALPAAYTEIASRILSMKGVVMIGVPCIEIYRCHRVVADLPIQHVDIYIPVSLRRAAKSAR